MSDFEKDDLRGDVLCLWTKTNQMTFIREANLCDPLTKLIMFVLLSKVDPREPHAEGESSLRELVKATGAEDWSVSIALRWLEAEGYLYMRTKQSCDPTEFFFNIESRRHWDWVQPILKSLKIEKE